MRSENLIEAEQALIAACIKDKSGFIKVSESITIDDFKYADHKLIFAAVSKVIEDDHPLDLFAVASAAVSLDPSFDQDDRKMLLIDYFENSYSDPKAIDYYSKIIRADSKRRKLAERINHWGEQFATTDPTDLISQITADAGELSMDQSAEGMKPEQSLPIVIETLARNEQLDGTVDGLSTGLSQLDERWEGMKAGQLIILAARPAMGKSLVASHIAFNAAKDNHVLFFSLEMTCEELMTRELASKGDFELKYFKNPKRAPNPHQFYEGVKLGVTKLKGLNITIQDDAGLHINQIIGRARAFNQKNKAGLIVIDHISIVQTDAKQSREREMAEISWKLKALAKELGCPVLAVAQLNRGVEGRTDKRPQMSDLRDSGSVEQDADIVAMVYRDDYYNENSEFKGTVEILTKKNRSGSIGEDRFSIELTRSKISDLATGPDYGSHS